MNNTTTAGQSLNEPTDLTCFLTESEENSLAAEEDKSRAICTNKVAVSDLKQWKIEDKSLLEPRVEQRMVQPVGVDTMSLWMPMEPGMIRALHGLKPLSVRKGARNRPLWHEGTTPVYGGRYWDEGRGIRIIVGPIKSERYAYGRGMIVCYIKFSLPKLLMENNYQPLSYEEMRAALGQVEDLVRRIGVNIEVEKAGLCRLDLFRNVVMDEPSRSYAPIFKTIYIPYVTTQSYANGVQLRNKSQSLTIYDKLAQLEAKGRSTLGVPQNALRVEWQLKKARKVQDKLGIKTVGDLLANFDFVMAQYDDFLSAEVFPFSHCAPPLPRRGRTECDALVQKRLLKIEELLRKRGVEDVTSARMNGLYNGKGIEDVHQLLKSYSHSGAFKSFVSSQIAKLRIAACDRALVGVAGRRFAELSEKLLGA